MSITTDGSITDLRAECGDFVHLPGEPGYDRARANWNAAVSLRPAAVAVPRSVEQVRRVVRTAARAGMRVTTQSTGHAAAVLAQHRLADTVLVRTGELRGVHVDPVNRVARVEAGACWQDVVEAAAPHGLTAMHGSAPDVGVVGYSLGGGLSWYARSHGLACNNLVSIDVVTADGEVVRADERENADLFWALRGGGGNFGVVTMVEVRLLPIAEVYAGMLLWPLEQAAEVVRTWAAWCADAPEQVTTSLRALRFPPIAELPDFLRGRQVLVVDGVVQAGDAEAEALLAPLRALAPELDTFGRMPTAALTRLHMDPEDPTPGVGDSVLLTRFDDRAVEEFLAAVGPGAAAAPFIAELRQLGGALARTAPGAGALASLDGTHALLLIDVAPTPAAAAAAEEVIASVLARMAPWTGRQRFLNFTERPTDPAAAFDEAAWGRLREVARAVDPAGVFLGNHAIPR
ncbi:FAD-binding oxidoreductase [Marmoricola sp. RAF53]|uniref:FAD-binding oxidoreductase n=1 Tax=Marmoricola sp. RAF53 TaxID=3233059 RepID=UPI003F94C2BD